MLFYISSAPQACSTHSNSTPNIFSKRRCRVTRHRLNASGCILAQSHEPRAVCFDGNASTGPRARLGPKFGLLVVCLLFVLLAISWDASLRDSAVGLCYCCCWLLAAACWLLAAGCWLLVVGWLLVAVCWLLAAGCWLMVAGWWLLLAAC